MSTRPAPFRTAPVDGVPGGWSCWLLTVLLALVPLSTIVPWRLKTLPPALLFVAGLVLFAQPDVRRAWRRALPALAGALVVVAMDIANVLGHGLGWRPLDHAGHVVLYLVIVAAFARPIRMDWVWAGFSLTALAIGAVCLVQHDVLGIERAYGLNGGPSASIECATILLALALLALARLLRPGCRGWERLVHGGGLLLGLYGAFVTQSRGPLLAFVPALAVQVGLYAHCSGRWRASLRLVLGVLLIGGVAAASLGGALSERFDSIDRELVRYDRGHPGPGAIVDRLGMWDASRRAIAAHPWTGLGLDRFHAFLRQEVDAGRSSPALARYNQPHNEYLRALVDGGIPQLLALLLFLLAPVRFLVGQLGRSARHAAVASGAIGVVVLFAVCGLGDSVFYRVMTQSIFLFTVLGLSLYLAARPGSDALEATP